MTFHDWFPAGYSCEIDPEFPPRGEQPDLYLLDELDDEVGARRYIRFEADERTWTVAIPEGAGGPSLVVSTPNASQCLVCASGNGVIVSVSDPGQSQTIGLYPVCGVLPVHHPSRLVLWSFDSVICLNDTGVAWHHNDLVLDELHVEVGEGGLLEVTGWAVEAKRFQIEPVFGTLIN